MYYELTQKSQHQNSHDFGTLNMKNEVRKKSPAAELNLHDFHSFKTEFMNTKSWL